MHRVTAEWHGGSLTMKRPSYAIQEQDSPEDLTCSLNNDFFRGLSLRTLLGCFTYDHCEWAFQCPCNQQITATRT